MSDYIVLCDFDGTITLEDTCVKILQQFAEGNWQKYDHALEREEISLHECMQSQFGMIKASKSTLVDFLGHVSLREGFLEFATYCSANNIPLIVVSAGLDFIIEEVLTLNHLALLIVSAKTSFKNGIQLTFPSHYLSNSVDFKEDLVKYYKNQHKQVIFIGDGNSDLHGALAADIVYAVKGKFLSSQIGTEFSHFKELQDKIQNLI